MAMDSDLHDWDGPEGGVWFNPREDVWIAEEWVSPGPYTARGEGRTREAAIQALEAILAQEAIDRAEEARLAAEEEAA